MTRGGLAVLLAALCCAACTITKEQTGSPVLLRSLDPPADGARADDVVRELGVPDAIDATDQGFHFLYRFRQRDEDKLAIAYYVKLFTDQRAVHRQGVLELWFDAGGTLLASKLREGDRDGTPP